LASINFNLIKNLLVCLVTALVMAVSAVPDWAAASPDFTQATSSLSKDQLDPLYNIPLGRLPDQAKPSRYRLNLTIDPSQERFSGRSQIDLTLNTKSNHIFLHGRNLKVSSVEARFNGKTITGDYLEVDPSGVALLRFTQDLPSQTLITLSIAYDARFGDSAAGLYRIKVETNWYSWTQFQSIDARSAFPSFDEPEFKTPFEVTIKAPKGQLALSNAPLKSSRHKGEMTEHVFIPTEPLPTYLMAFVVGPFITAEGVAPPTKWRKKPLPLRIVATQNHKGKLDFALKESIPIIEKLEAYFDMGFPYPKLDQIGSPVMPGAMENAGADIYHDDIILMQDTAPTEQKQSFGMVVSHELSHQWFGDYVTPQWWDDIWLNESFANWMGYKIGNEWKPELNIGVGALDEGFAAMSLDSLKVGRPIRETITKNADIDQAFDQITYGKGGHVVNMFAAYLGDEAFRDGVRLHMRRYPHGTANTIQFFGSLSDAAKDERLTRAMKSFVEQQGVPVVSLNRTEEGINLTQYRYARLGTELTPQTWLIPVCVRDLKGPSQCLLLDERSKTMPVRDIQTLIPNAGGLGYYRIKLSSADWDHLINRATDLSAGEALAALDSLFADFSAGNNDPARLIRALKAFAHHKDSNVALDPAQRLQTYRLRGYYDEATTDQYRALIRTIYGQRLNAMGSDLKPLAYLNDDPDRSKLRIDLITLMIQEGHDQDLTDRLITATQSKMAGDKNALDPVFLALGHTMMVKKGGMTAMQSQFDSLEKPMDPEDKNAVIRSLAAIENKVHAQWIIDRMDDKRLNNRGRFIILAELMGSPQTIDLGFEYLKANYDVLAKQNGGIFAAARLSNLPRHYCDTQRATEINTLLRDKVQAAGRGTLGFDRMIEGIESCGRHREAKSQALRAAIVGAN